MLDVSFFVSIFQVRFLIQMYCIKTYFQCVEIQVFPRDPPFKYSFLYFSHLYVKSNQEKRRSAEIFWELIHEKNQRAVID